MVSVIIPVYNGEQYIRQCLDSLLSENTDSMEVIAINDGSRDGSLALLREYAEKYSCLRVIDKENEGAARTRKRGIAEAKGEWIGFLDIDDRAESNMYSSLEKKAKESGADIVFCNYVEESSKGGRVVRNCFDKEQSFPLTGKEALSYLHRRQAVFPFPWNKIYKAELLRSVEFPTGNFVGEDYNMLLQLFGKVQKIDFLDIAPYHYVLTENSASRGGYGEATVRAYEHFGKDYAFMCDRYPDMKREVTHYLMTEYMAMIIAMGRNKTYNKQMIKEIKSFVRSDFWSFVCASYVPIAMKGSAVALSISYRLLVAMYRLLG